MIDSNSIGKFSRLLGSDQVLVFLSLSFGMLLADVLALCTLDPMKLGVSRENARVYRCLAYALMLLISALIGWLTPGQTERAVFCVLQLSSKPPKCLRRRRAASSRVEPEEPQDEESRGLINTLRTLQKDENCFEEITRVLTESMERREYLDEAFYCTFVDTCIRLRRIDMLGEWLRKTAPSFCKIKKEPTFRRVIRAYGAVDDLPGARFAWATLRKLHGSLACITVGCMVDALVSNGDADAAYNLVKDLQAEQKDLLLNSVIYGTLIKGFALERRCDRAWATFQEMRAKGFSSSILTFNTLIDACSRCEQTQRIPGLLEEMSELGLRPDLLTYGTALKGYCREGSIDRALTLLQTMHETTELKLDARMYHSLLEVCGKNKHSWDNAKAVLLAMVESGCHPTCYTLCVLVGVARRSVCPIGDVFDIVDDLACDHSIDLDIHVYTSLVHLSVYRKDWARALGVFSKLVRQGLSPDVNSYAVLLKGLVAVGLYGTADAVLRAALGMPGAEPSLLASAQNSVWLLCPDVAVPNALILDVVDGMLAGGKPGWHLPAQLLEDTRTMGMQIYPTIKLRIAVHVGHRAS